MPTADSRRDFAVDVVRRLQSAGFTALWAGGCVRDSLLGRTPADYDVATDARPDDVRKLFGRRRTLAIGASFGVIIVLAPRSEDNVEVATFRTEGPYRDGRRPDSVAFSSPEADALRRDFTINGMFYDPAHDKIQDFVGGEDDLRQRVVRAIGDPHHRIAEDKLRMLRAVRIAAMLDFSLDETTAAAVREMSDEIVVVSAERIAQEFSRMLAASQRVRAMESLRELGLLKVILPELIPALDEAEEKTTDGHWAKTLRILGELRAPSLELAFAALLHEIPPISPPPSDEECPKTRAQRNAHTVWGICKRLRLSNQIIDRTCWLVKHRNHLLDAPNLPLHVLKRLLAQPHAEELIALNRAEAISAGVDCAAVEFSERFLAKTPTEELNPPLLVSGDDLVKRGLKPGKQFKEILDEVRDRQLDGEIDSKKEALLLVDGIVGSRQ